MAMVTKYKRSDGVENGTRGASWMHSASYDNNDNNNNNDDDVKDDEKCTPPIVAVMISKNSHCFTLYIQSPVGIHNSPSPFLICLDRTPYR